MSWVQPPPALAGLVPAECVCAHQIMRHLPYCTVVGCGCRVFRDRGDGPVVPVPDNTNPDRPF